MNKKLQISLVALAVGSSLSLSAQAALSDVLITEYASSSSYGSKAIEISNTGSSDYTFTDQALYYQGSKFTNMVQTSTGSNVLKNVTVKAGSSIVILRSDADSVLRSAVPDEQVVIAGSYSEVGHNTLNMNGDDVVFIALESDKSVIHDLVGDNSSSWHDKGYKKVFRRSERFTTPSKTIDRAKLVASDDDYDYSDLGKTTFFSVPTATNVCDASNGEVVTPEEAQGQGENSPFVDVANGKFESDEFFEITGVVTRVTSGLTQGFYLQEDGSDELASDAIFVNMAGAPTDLTGKQVCVYGKIKESGGMTSITAERKEYQEMGTGSITPTTLQRVDADGDSFSATLERYEGMVITLPEDIDPQESGVQDMRVTRTFSYDYGFKRNNMVLAYKQPNIQPNQKYAAGSAAAKAQAAKNLDRRLVVDSDAAPAKGKVPFRPAMAAKSTANKPEGYIRVNDSVSGLEGIIHYLEGNYRLLVEGDQPDARFTHNSDRSWNPDISKDAGKEKFAITVATQNVLNFFNSAVGGSPNQQRDDNRGAKKFTDFNKQKDKIVSALYQMDADLVGLVEIENNGFSAEGAIAELVESLNDKYYREGARDRHHHRSSFNRYIFVGIDSNGDTVLDEDDHIGTDVITTGIIYRPDKLTLLNSSVIKMPIQKAPPISNESGELIYNTKGEVQESGSNYHRDVAVAKFQVNGTGRTFNFAVNHFKSKGSTCWEDWAGWKEWENFDPTQSRPDVKDEDFQGNCENFRVAGAQRLGEVMQRLGGDRIITGDLNSYAKEDPMLLLTSNPTNKQLKTSAYTLVNGIPVSGTEGKVLNHTYGYINAVEAKTPKGEMSWSYQYGGELGSLDYMLISDSLNSRLIDAIDWNINSSESPLYGYKYSTSDTYKPDAFRSSDHDPAIMTLAYDYFEAGEEKVRLPIYENSVSVTYVIPGNVKANPGDIAKISVSPMGDNNSQLLLPEVKISDDKQRTVEFNVSGLKKGNYTFAMKLTRSGMAQSTENYKDVENSEVAVTAEVIKADSLSEPKVTIPEYDGTGGGSGGSMGTLSSLGLFGLILARRRRAKES